MHDRESNRRGWAVTSVREPEKPRVTAPTSCPFCWSLNLKTTSKILDESTYWRCMTCGEIWNPGRQGRASPRFSRHD